MPSLQRRSRVGGPCARPHADDVAQRGVRHRGRAGGRAGARFRTPAHFAPWAVGTQVVVAPAGGPLPHTPRVVKAACGHRCAAPRSPAAAVVLGRLRLDVEEPEQGGARVRTAHPRRLPPPPAPPLVAPRRFSDARACCTSTSRVHTRHGGPGHPRGGACELRAADDASTTCVTGTRANCRVALLPAPHLTPRRADPHSATQKLFEDLVASGIAGGAKAE